MESGKDKGAEDSLCRQVMRTISCLSSSLSRTVRAGLAILRAVVPLSLKFTKIRVRSHVEIWSREEVRIASRIEILELRCTIVMEVASLRHKLTSISDSSISSNSKQISCPYSSIWILEAIKMQSTTTNRTFSLGFNSNSWSKVLWFGTPKWVNSPLSKWPSSNSTPWSSRPHSIGTTYSSNSRLSRPHQTHRIKERIMLWMAIWMVIIS